MAGRRGNEFDSALARCKARSRLPRGHNSTFFPSLYTAEALIRRNRPLLKGVSHYGGKYKAKGLRLPPSSI